MKTAVIFVVAILSEVFATTALKYAHGFTKLVPSIFVALGYGASFYLLSISLKVIPIGLAYAIWSGVGIVLTVIIGAVLWREPIDWMRGLGIFLIICGVFVINLSLKTTAH
ncbi:MAG: multidrug efflux SMR transporter [Anaerolineaceae bacterium]|nr:multidrug efflux SMR transporter [Anaerolineaceae bacterium]